MGILASKLSEEFKSGSYEEIFKKLYVDENRFERERIRYSNSLNSFIDIFGDKEVEIYSAPGRCEIGGNHTDHQHGKVLAASVNIDVIAIVAKTNGNNVRLFSEGYGEVEVDISKLEPNEDEYGTTAALIRGVASGLKKRGFNVGGFEGYITSEVLSGSGLSSSAAVEVLLAQIISGMYNENKVDPVMKAQIGQDAENIFFGKPCGLLDQMGCSVGGLVYIDFKDPKTPIVDRVDVDFDVFGQSLCVVDTKASHADLTDEYAKIPEELGKVCEVFDKKYLRDIPEEEFYSKITSVRKHAGDRAVLRAIHIYDDNKRVENMRKSLLEKDYSSFKQLVKDSGNSSYRYLQNVYATKKVEEQSVAFALVMTKKILGKDCACRIQGGGFAGTIEVFIPNEDVAYYKKEIEKLFGEGACHVLKIRSVGGAKVI